MARKQTKLWTTKSGEKIRVCDMSNTHLINTIKMLERLTEEKTFDAINTGESMLCCLQGEMAIDSVEGELNDLYTYGINPCDIFPIMISLIEDATRRGLNVY